MPKILKDETLYDNLSKIYIHMPTNKNEYKNVKNKVVKDVFDFSRNNNLKLKIFNKHEDVEKELYQNNINENEIKLIVLNYGELIYFEEDNEYSNFIILSCNNVMTINLLQDNMRINITLENEIFKNMKCMICDTEEYDTYFTCPICSYIMCEPCGKQIVELNIMKCPKCRTILSNNKIG